MEPTPPISTPGPSYTGLRHRRNVCTECRRQKQRCDRQTPCSNCLRRRIPHLCHLPAPTRSSSYNHTPLHPAEPRPAQAQDRVLETLEPPPSTSTPSELATSPPAPSSRPSGIGHLWNTRGAPSYHGSSHFGHQMAADMIHVESPALPVGLRGIHASSSRRDDLYQPRRSEKGVYTHIWELVGYLPRRKAAVDNLVRLFLDELNPVYDSLHEDTFRAAYDVFWNRRWGDDDLTSVDLRWLALLFMVLAFGELLDCPLDCSPEMQSECEEASLQYFWASRKAVVIAPTFTGESPDLVRAGILISRYLVYLGRKNESWLTCSFAVRMAQGQGMHIDGESWRLPPKVLETRRRLWSALYSFDRSISLAIGRPYAINDRHCMVMNIKNVWVDDKPQDEGLVVEEHPIHDPTPSVFYIYQQKLAGTMGRIHDECFGLDPQDSSYNTYNKVMALDTILLEWANSLPPYFRFNEPDSSMDDERPYLRWQRIYLHSGFHFARVTLHRTFVFQDSITDRFQYSRNACIDSACADLKLKLGSHTTTMGDRLRAGVAMHNLFNSALVMGIIAVRQPSSPKTAAILQDLAAYCEKQIADPWANEFVLAEVKVIELCIASARSARRDHEHSEMRARDVNNNMLPPMPEGAEHYGVRQDATSPHLAKTRTPLPSRIPENDMQTNMSDEHGRMDACDNWADSWFGPNRNFPEPVDYHLWEDLIGTLIPQ